MNYKRPRTFSPDTIQAAESVTVNFSDRPQVLGFTIDAITSKDLDDAIWIEPTNNGVVISVHIADVDAYVPQGSLLDQDAYLRVETEYLPDKTYPMFPYALSHNKCSLLEGELRPTITVRVTLDHQANLVNTEIHETRLSSLKKFSYPQVDRTLNDPSSELFAVLRYCDTWSQKLNYIRIRQGALGGISIGNLAFDEEGNIVPRSYRSQQIIAEFMIVANTAIAEFFRQREIVALYRNHQPGELPEHRKEFIESLTHLGDENSIRKYLQPYLKCAVYEPKAIGHFALNIPSYCHFTSPIRRYADLVNHRIIKAYLHNKDNVYQYSGLEQIGENINEYRQRQKNIRDKVYKEIFLAKVNEQLKDESCYAILSSSEFTKLLELSKDISKLEGDILTRLREDRLSVKDIGLILFDHSFKHPEIVEWVKRNPSLWMQCVTTTVKQLGKDIDFIFAGEDENTPPFLVWLIIDNLTTVEGAEANSKKDAKQQAALSWITAYIEDKLVDPKERQLPSDNVHLFSEEIEEIEDTKELDIEIELDVELNEDENPIGVLNTWSQRLGCASPKYSFSGSQNKFTCAVTLNIMDNNYTTNASGRSKKEAKHKAAKLLLTKIIAHEDELFVEY